MGSLQEAFASYLVSNYCNIAATAFVFYDLIITLEDEIRFFWTRKLTGATVLFWLNKWLNILFFTISLVTGLQLSNAACFIYFLVLALIDALHLILTLLSMSEFIATDASYLTSFSAPITAILVSRFMLHLQYANVRSTGMASSQEPTASNMGSLMFERALGSLGASISPDDYFPTEPDYDNGNVEERLAEGVVDEEALAE